MTEEAPSIAPISYMEKIVTKTELTFRKGYNTVRFAKLPAGGRSVDAVFGRYAGNPLWGSIFSFERPMQYLLLHGRQDRRQPEDPGVRPQLHDLHQQGLHDRHDNWVDREVIPATTLPSTKHRGKASR